MTTATRPSIFATVTALATFACTACAVATSPPAGMAPPSAKDAGLLAPDASSPAFGADAATEAAVDAGSLALGCDGGAPPSADGTHVSDPSITVTQTSDGYILHKELAGYPNYGNPDDAADGLYTGETGTYNFPIPTGVVGAATVTVQIIDDDHGPGSAYGNLSPSLYSYRLWAGSCPHDDSGLTHGVPYGESFTNWAQRSYPADGVVPGANYTVTITNTSNTGAIDWIAIDWIEIHVTTVTAPN